MGGGNSRLIRNKGGPPSDTSTKLTSREPISGHPSTYISSFLRRRPSNGFEEQLLITPELMWTCTSSWTIITSERLIQNNREYSGSTIFTTQFFTELSNLDPEGTILTKLQSKNTKNKCHYERVLLMKMMNYVLNILDESFSIKSKIRSIGRNHARIGVGPEAIMLFNEAILRTIATRLNTAYLIQHDVIRCWTSLLEFVLGEMTVERVQFLRCDSGAIISSDGGNSTRRFSGSENVKTVAAVVVPLTFDQPPPDHANLPSLATFNFSVDQVVQPVQDLVLVSVSVQNSPLASLL